MNARTYKTSHSQENMNKSHIPLYVENLILTCGILFFSLQMQAQKNDTQLSFSIRNASLEEFIKYLENSTGFSFIYGEEVKISRRITLEVKQKTIREILDQAFKNEPIGYQIAGRHILLQKKKQKPVSRKFTISGYVTDGTSAETLIGANILESRHKQGTTTNPYGFYSITLPMGETELSFSYLGYETQYHTLALNKDTVLNVLMQDNNQLEEVVIVSDKTEAGITATQMGAIEIPMAQIKNTPGALGEADVMKTIQLTSWSRGFGRIVRTWRRSGSKSDSSGWNTHIQCRSPIRFLLGFYTGSRKKSNIFQKFLSCTFWRPPFISSRRT